MKTKLFFAATLLLLTVNLLAQTSGTCGDNLTWTLQNNSTLIISGTGKMTDYISIYPYSEVATPWGISGIKNRIKHVIITNGVTRIGNGAFRSCYYLESVTIPNSVTVIGYKAFEDCNSLTSVTIPNGVTLIGDEAFTGCRNLTSIYWDANISLSFNPSSPFYQVRSQITSFTIGDNVKQIGNYLCFEMSALKEIKIPNSVTSIGGSAFWGCHSLTSVNIPNGVTSIDKYAFKYCSSLTSVYWDANISFSFESSSPFYELRSQITSFTIGDNVKQIGDYLCYGMSALKEIKIPENVTSIGSSAFQSCSNLTSVYWDANINFSSYSSSPFYNLRSQITSFTIGDNVKQIGDYLCYGMLALKEIKIPENVTSIGSSAFYTCSNLTSVTIPNSVTSVGNKAFSGCSGLTKPIYNSCIFAYMPTSYSGVYTIPSGIKAIAGTAFEGCRSLTGVIIPNSVTSIGSKSFYECNSLKNVNITDISAWCNIEFGNASANPLYNKGHLYLNEEEVVNLYIPHTISNISAYAFYNCAELEIVTIGESIESIGEYAFSGCSRITDIYCYAKRVPSIGFDPFESVSRKATLWVPENRLRNYQTNEYWGEFDVQPMGAESANTDKVVVTPDYNTANIAWPQVANVDSYELVIKDKSGDEVCTLVFNGEGQLQSIAFHAPKMNSGEEADFAPKQTQATGFRFTVTGLESGSQYDYTLTAKDAAGKTLQTYTGSFYTLGTTGLDDLETNDPASMSHARKIIEDGKVFILLPDGRRFTLQGAEVR
ncbi:MAG: leucine-rich repeat domain-containing protein [Paludibacteraceae bacterium]|nr:leucine-rich repeat domain-containing protein [Paludibacteraceae bacterium]